MRLAFLGTPVFAAVCLAALAKAGHEIACVYSQAAKPRGRGQAVKPSPVEQYAHDHGLMVRTPRSMRDPDEVAAFAALQLDAAAVVAFGQILPKAVLDAPRLGSFNLHASLLPRWRGAAPIQRALMAGDHETAAQVMRMTEGLDEGPVLSSAIVPIEADEIAGTLHDKLAVARGVSAGGDLRRHRARRGRRDAAGSRRGHLCEKDRRRRGAHRLEPPRPRGRPDDPRPVALPRRLVHGPSAKGETRIKALLSRAEDAAGPPGPPPGTVLDDAGLIACGQGAVRLLGAQREGKGPQGAGDFLRGFPLLPGTRLA